MANRYHREGGIDLTEGKVWPTEIKLRKDRRLLTVAFDDGTSYDLPAEALRVLSPSAEVQGHSPDQKKTVPGKKNVEIVGVEPIGNYAVKLVFDDMHDTGIFTWVYFKELGEDFDKLWGGYLDALDAANLSREPMIGLGEPSGSGGGCGSGSCGCGH